MAKAADRKQKAQPAPADDLEAALAAAMATEEIDFANDDLEIETAPVKVEPVKQTAPPKKVEYPASTFDISSFANVSENVQRRFGNFAESFDGLRRDWQALDEQLVSSRDEVVRLQAIEQDRGRLVGELDEGKATIARLEKELAATRADVVTATERATKFEEICESIKERAFELHTALQDVQAKEEKNLADLETTRTQLADASRRAQDEGVARVAADERNKEFEAQVKRLEADGAAARDRIAKLAEDNKTITSQVPALLSDRDRLQKQFSASERENTRLVSERQTLSDRVRGLEDEIRTLRADLGSLSSAPVIPLSPVPVIPLSGGVKKDEPKREEPAKRDEPLKREEPKPAAAAAPKVEPTRKEDDILLDDDDFDLEASLERVFSAEMANAKGKK